MILEPQYAGVLILDDDGGLWSGSVCMCARTCHVYLSVYLFGMKNIESCSELLLCMYCITM